MQDAHPDHPTITNPDWVTSWAYRNLVRRAAEGKCTNPLRFSFNSIPLTEDVREEVLKCIESFGVSLSCLDEGIFAWDDDYEQTYVWQDGALFLASTEDLRRFGLTLVSTNHELVEKVREITASMVTRQERSNRGRVHVLVEKTGGIGISALGFAATDLILDNYDSGIHQQILSMTESLKEDFPDGRLSILEGVPGCGKTFLVRSLVGAIPNATFVFVPPALIPRLGDPSMVSALISLKEDNGQIGPTVLICEDADSVLTKRKADNMAAISSILNLTSGILGDLIDVRIVATTNSQRAEIDDALLRSGRLSHYIHVPPLDVSYAADLLNKMVPGAEVPEDWSETKAHKEKRIQMGFGSVPAEKRVKGVILADVYRYARSQGWSPRDHLSKVEDHGLRVRAPRPRRVIPSPVASGKGERRLVSLSNCKAD